MNLPRFDTLVLERRGPAAWITLNRPDAMNSLNPASISEFGEALDVVCADRALRCVVVTGAGRAFCAGADLRAARAMAGDEAPPGALEGFLGAANALLARIERLPLPVIAAVNGLALAGGLEIVLCCDLVVAAREAMLGDGHAKYGLLPGWGGSARLPRKIGVNRAKQLMYTAELVPAGTLMDWGLVNQVVPLADLQATTDALAARLAGMSPLGLRRMKELVHGALDRPLDAALRHEQIAAAAHSRSGDCREGLAAFAQKRKPHFDGT